MIQAEVIEKRLRMHNKVKPALMDDETWMKQLLEEGQLTEEEVEKLQASAIATRAVIMVDEFTAEQITGWSKPANKVA